MSSSFHVIGHDLASQASERIIDRKECYERNWHNKNDLRHLQCLPRQPLEGRHAFRNAVEGLFVAGVDRELGRELFGVVEAAHF